MPLHQYTAREVWTGVLFFADAGELSLTYAELFAERISRHLKKYGVRMEGVTWQTDNGSEFVGSWQATEESAFTRTVESFGSARSSNLTPIGVHDVWSHPLYMKIVCCFLAIFVILVKPSVSLSEIAGDRLGRERF